MVDKYGHKPVRLVLPTPSHAELERADVPEQPGTQGQLVAGPVLHRAPGRLRCGKVTNLNFQGDRRVIGRAAAGLREPGRLAARPGPALEGRNFRVDIGVPRIQARKDGNMRNIQIDTTEDQLGLQNMHSANH